MTGRRLIVVVAGGFLVATVCAVVIDLQQAFRNRPVAGQLNRGSARLEAVAELESPFYSEDDLAGDAEFALLLDSDNKLPGLELTSGQNDLTLPVGTRPNELPSIEASERLPAMTAEQRSQNVAAIKQIYPQASEEQVEFWLNETRGLPPRMIQEMLRLRTEIGPLTESFGNQESLAVEELAPKPTFDSSRTHLIAMRRVYLENMLNAESIGYRKTELITVEDLDADGNRIVRIAERRLSMTPGARIPTGDSLDLYLEGNWFLVVESQGERLLTRNGNLTLGPDRTLSLVTGNSEHEIVVPGISIPESVVELRIGTDTMVTGIDRESGEKVSLGTITLATVDQPQFLKPAGNSLYATTAQSGEIRVLKTASAGLSAVSSGFLEQANVTWAKEEAKLLAINRLLTLHPPSE